MKDFDVKDFANSVTEAGNGVMTGTGALSLYEKRFQDTTFFGFEAVRSAFTDCVFNHCDFRCVDVNHSTFEGCTFTNCTFTLADLSYCWFTNCTFNNEFKTAFLNSVIGAARFRLCSLDGIYFYGCNAEGLVIGDDSHVGVLQFGHCDLDRASISPICEEGIYFSKCNLLKSHICPVPKEDASMKLLNDHCIIYGADFPAGQWTRKGRILTESMSGFKKCIDNLIVTLRIPEGAVVFQPNMGKCRTNIAEVMDIRDSHGNKVECAYSKWNRMFEYRVGDVKRVNDFCLDPSIECAPGIHFFRTIEEAEDY